MDKHIVDCKTKELAEKSFTTEELAQRELELQLAEEQALLDSLLPSQQEIEQAEFELNTINLLMEVGLI